MNYNRLTFMFCKLDQVQEFGFPPWMLIFFCRWILECLRLTRHIDPENLGTDLTATRLDSPGFISPLVFFFLRQSSLSIHLHSISTDSCSWEVESGQGRVHCIQSGGLQSCSIESFNTFVSSRTFHWALCTVRLWHMPN